MHLTYWWSFPDRLMARKAAPRRKIALARHIHCKKAVARHIYFVKGQVQQKTQQDSYAIECKISMPKS